MTQDFNGITVSTGKFVIDDVQCVGLMPTITLTWIES
jgi:hypothetical protein